MTAKSITDALALAAWELAEAEGAIRRAEREMAQGLRRHKRAAQHLAQLHEQISLEIKTLQSRTA